MRRSLHRRRAGLRGRAGTAALAAGLALAAWAPAAPAQQPASRAGPQAEVALSSELTDRGLSIGPRRPVAQGMLTFHPATGWSAGLGASLSSQGLDTTRLVAHASRYAALSNDWQLQAGMRYYAYTSPAARAYDRAEANLAWAYRDTLSLGFSASRGTGSRRPGGHRLQPAADMGWRWPLAQQAALSAGLGYSELPQHAGRGYAYGNAGIDWQGVGWRLELSYIANDGRARRLLGDSARPRWSATIARTLF